MLGDSTHADEVADDLKTYQKREEERNGRRRTDDDRPSTTPLGTRPSAPPSMPAPSNTPVLDHDASKLRAAENHTETGPVQQGFEGCAGARELETCVAVDDIRGAGAGKGVRGTVEGCESQRLQTIVRVKNPRYPRLRKSSPKDAVSSPCI